MTTAPFSFIDESSFFVVVVGDDINDELRLGDTDSRASLGCTSSTRCAGPTYIDALLLTCIRKFPLISLLFSVSLLLLILCWSECRLLGDSSCLVELSTQLWCDIRRSRVVRCDAGIVGGAV